MKPKHSTKAERLVNNLLEVADNHPPADAPKTEAADPAAEPQILPMRPGEDIAAFNDRRLRYIHRQEAEQLDN